QLLGMIKKFVGEGSKLKEFPRRSRRKQRADHDVGVNHQPHADGPPAAGGARHPLPPGSAGLSATVAPHTYDRTPPALRRTARRASYRAAVFAPAARAAASVREFAQP